MDQKYQQQQEKLQAKQQKDLQKLQQKQEQEHQQMAKQQVNQAKQQQMEQRHQQQTQQLQQKHAQQAIFGARERDHRTLGIEQMAVRGITKGCGGSYYCPEAAVTRGQMAVFLVRAFGW